MSRDAVELVYAVAQLRFSQVARPAWQVQAWEFRCRELAARLLDTGAPFPLF
jgi:alkylation response protein AidB-like acyl-CoA dehydrogenase